MKNILFMFAILVSFISFSQEFKLNNENVENLEILSIEVEYNKYINDLEIVRESHKIVIDKLKSDINAKVKKFTKEQARKRESENIRRAEEVKKDFKIYTLSQEKYYKILENKLSDGLIALLTRVSKKENCVVIFDDEISENKTVYLDRERQPLVINNSKSLRHQSETSIRNYFDENGAELIEGIWEVTAQVGQPNYRLVIFKKDYNFQATVTEVSGMFSVGDLKATFETAASDKILTINWINSDKSNSRFVGTVANNAIINFNLEKEVTLYRVYPKFNKKVVKAIKGKNKKDEWAGNGSGLIISKSGHIITNHHVIEDAEDIEVEFLLNDKIQKFNAEIVQVDKTNDLAVLKIFDMNFDGMNEPPYNFKLRGSDVGTKVYAFGYPMALSIMGKEIKVTDGMISSKTGFDGNITTYQITAPIQGGNSGGPLFDEQANLIGINSSGIRKDIADNVAYSIKTSYVSNLLDVLPKSIELPSSTRLKSLSLIEQIKEISKYVVLIKVK